MNETVNILDLLLVLKNRWKPIILLSLLLPIISGFITYFLLTPVYQGTTLILVNSKSSENISDLSQLSDNIGLINTYGGIIKSPVILGKVIEELNLSESVDQLTGRITINSQQDSQIFSLTVEDSDASQAVLIANTISKTFQKEIKEIMRIDNVNILAEAEIKEHPTPVKPNLLFNIAIAFVVGFMGGIGVAMLSEVMDSTLKDDHDVEAYLGLPILGSVQMAQKKDTEGKWISRKLRRQTFEA